MNLESNSAQCTAEDLLTAHVIINEDICIYIVIIRGLFSIARNGKCTIFHAV